MAVNPISTNRVVSLRVLNFYTYPVGVWAIGLFFLYGAELVGLETTSGVPIEMEFGIALCYPLALWNAVLSLWWAVSSQRKLSLGKVSQFEVNAGVRLIGHLLTSISGSPAIIFLAADPLHQAAWATCASVAIMGGLAFVAVSALTRIPGKITDTLALTVACAALPINATGAVSLGWWLGLFDPLLTPVFSVTAG